MQAKSFLEEFVYLLRLLLGAREKACLFRNECEVWVTCKDKRKEMGWAV